MITGETEHALDVPDVLGLSGEGDVVVDELAPGDEHDGDGVVVETLVLMNRAGHGTGRGQGRALKGNTTV